MTALEQICPEINSAQAKLLYRTICEKLPLKLEAWYGQGTMRVENKVFQDTMTEVETILRGLLLEDK